MILTGEEIAAEVIAGRIVIEGFDGCRLEPNSYGFRLSDQIIRYDSDLLDCAVEPSNFSLTIPDDGIVLEPGRLYLGSTIETMGSPHYAATLYASRSAASLGLWIQFSAPLGHSGSIFPWTLEMVTTQRLRVFPGMVIGKIAFWAMLGEPTTYSGKYIGSKSAVASRLSADTHVRRGVRGTA